MWVRLVVHRHELADAGLRVSLRGRKRDVAEKFLNGAKVRAIGKQMRGKRVAQRMRMQAPVDITEPRVFFHEHAHGAVVKRPPR